MTDKERYIKNWFRWIYRLVLFSTLAISMNTTAAEEDFSRASAVHTPLAVSSKFMDVARAGDRIVAVGERGHILYSDDDGNRWQQAQVPVSVLLTSVSFATPNEGWAVGHEGVVLHSADAGVTWEKAVEPQWINQQMLASVERLVARKRQALDSASETQKETASFELEDAEYFLSDIQAITAASGGQPLMKVWFENSRHGLIVGAVGMAFETDDGGQTWNPIAEHLDNLAGSHFYAVAKGVNGLVLGGESGMLFSSMTNQTNWQRLPLDYEGSVFALFATQDQDCLYAVGFGGSVLKNCGHTPRWDYRQFGREGKTLTFGLPLVDGRLAILGMGSQLYISADNGDSFQAFKAGVSGSMAAVETDDGHLVLVGIQGIHRLALDDLRGYNYGA